MAARVPMEIIYEILLRLPVKSLLRFKCICKAWHELIETSYFVKSHLNHSIETNSNCSLIYNYRYETLYQIHGLRKNSPSTVLDFHEGLQLCDDFIDVIGACNGLICIKSLKRGLSLCNPSTRTFHMVPYVSDWRDACYGFGYDGECDDYKIVKLSRNCSVLVYNLRANSWSQAEPSDGLYYKASKSQNGIFLNNHLHWISRGKGQLYSFDLHDNTWKRVLALPKKNYYTCHLGVFDGCLFLHYHRGNPDKFEMWVMKEYGVEKSWTKVLSFNKEYDLFSGMYRHGLFQYNSWKKTMEQFVTVFGAWEVKDLYHMKFCIESLVPLKGNNDIDNLQGDQISRIRKIR